MEKNLFRILIITIFLNIWIPKGGVKLQGIPFTFGNISYVFLLILFILYILLSHKIKKDKISLSIFISACIFIVRLIIAEVYGNYSIGSIIPFICSLCIFPLIYIIINQLVDDEEKLHVMVKIVFYGFVFLSVYTILQIIFGIDKVAIPGITVNYSDFKESPLWYLEKSNNVGRYTKAISTYQNGNIFGVNLIIFFPVIFEFVENISNKKAYVLLILFLFVGSMTLSRACWLGLGVYVFFRFIFNRSKNKVDIILKVLFVTFIPIIVLYTFKYMPQLQIRLAQTDSSNLMALSGRAPNAFDLLSSTSDDIVSFLFGPYGISLFSGGAYEMTYLAIYMLSGIIGVIIWFIPIFSALFLFKKYKNNVIINGVFYSLITWLIVASIEGAFWLAPTGLNLWTIIALGSVSVRFENINRTRLAYTLAKEDIEKQKEFKEEFEV